MSMTLDEMKLAVCEKLPELVEHIVWKDNNLEHEKALVWKEQRWHSVAGLERVKIHWPTEGLQICHDVEKLLSISERNKYRRLIAWDSDYLQRLEALCRVWFPERFQ